MNVENSDALKSILGDQMSNGMRALLLVLGSAVLGAVYFSDTHTEPFQPDIVRLVPIVWLACALVAAVPGWPWL